VNLFDVYCQVSMPCEVRSFSVAPSIVRLGQQNYHADDEHQQEHPTDTPETASELTFTCWRVDLLHDDLSVFNSLLYGHWQLLLHH